MAYDAGPTPVVLRRATGSAPDDTTTLDLYVEGDLGGSSGPAEVAFKPESVTALSVAFRDQLAPLLAQVRDAAATDPDLLDLVERLAVKVEAGLSVTGTVGLNAVAMAALAPLADLSTRASESGQTALRASVDASVAALTGILKVADPRLTFVGGRLQVGIDTGPLATSAGQASALVELQEISQALAGGAIVRTTAQTVDLTAATDALVVSIDTQGATAVALRLGRPLPDFANGAAFQSYRFAGFDDSTRFDLRATATLVGGATRSVDTATELGSEFSIEQAQVYAFNAEGDLTRVPTYLLRLPPGVTSFSVRLQPGTRWDYSLAALSPEFVLSDDVRRLLGAFSLYQGYGDGGPAWRTSDDALRSVREYDSTIGGYVLRTKGSGVSGGGTTPTDPDAPTPVTSVIKREKLTTTSGNGPQTISLDVSKASGLVLRLYTVGAGLGKTHRLGGAQNSSEVGLQMARVLDGTGTSVDALLDLTTQTIISSFGGFSPTVFFIPANGANSLRFELPDDSYTIIAVYLSDATLSVTGGRSLRTVEEAVTGLKGAGAAAKTLADVTAAAAGALTNSQLRATPVPISTAVALPTYAVGVAATWNAERTGSMTANTSFSSTPRLRATNGVSFRRYVGIINTNQQVTLKIQHSSDGQTWRAVAQFTVASDASGSTTMWDYPFLNDQMRVVVDAGTTGPGYCEVRTGQVGE